MARVTDTEVREIVDSSPEISLAPFIAIANLLVNRVVTNDTSNCLGTDGAKSLELLLAAHYYQCRDNGYKSKSTGSASASFQGNTDMMFLYSPYGQSALTLDCTGTLNKIQQDAKATVSPKIGITWLGTDDA